MKACELSGEHTGLWIMVRHGKLVVFGILERVAHLYDYENAQTFNDPEPVQVKTYTRVELELLGDTNRPMPRCSLRVPGDADVVLCTP